MKKLGSILDWVGRANAAAWLWTLVPATVVSSAVGWLAYRDLQKNWAIALAAIAAFAFVSLAIATWRSHRAVSVSKQSFAELRKRAYDAELAELQGRADARRTHATRTFFGNITDQIGYIAEEHEARREAKLNRIRRGEE